MENCITNSEGLKNNSKKLTTIFLARLIPKPEPVDTGINIYKTIKTTIELTALSQY